MIKIKELDRPRLEEKLSQIWSRPLMIIAAPSGYGKTTLVRSYLKKQKDLKTAWMTWEQNEVDEAWVWKRLCRKCSEVDEEVGKLLGETELPATLQDINYLTGMIKDRIQAPFYLIIDDFQNCRSVNVERLITKLTYERIPGFHIVLISQIYPDIPYEEMFLKGYCDTINQKMLSLDKEETAEIFRINGIELRKEELDDIFKYTDGWIAAVYLALHDYDMNGQAGTFTSVSHLLKTAIFDKLTLNIRELYMKMSLFESFTLEEAAYIAEEDLLPAGFADAVERYGFIQYEPDLKRYQMHTLLRNVAAGELEKRKIDKKYLYNRGGIWLERKGDLVSAIVNYRNAGNYKAILILLSGESRYRITEAIPRILNEIFMDMPVELKQQYPVAWLTYIYSTIMSGDVNWGMNLYEEACSIYERMNPADEGAGYLKGELMAIGSLLEFNDLEKINQMIKAAYEDLGRCPSKIFQQALMTYGTPLMTLLHYNKAGGLIRTIELEKEYAHYHMRLVGIGDDGLDELFDAEYALLTGDMVNAYHRAQFVEQKAVSLKQPCIRISAYYIQLRSLIYMGRERELNDKMNEFHNFVKTLTRHTLIVDAALAYSYIYACLGEPNKMADWLKEFNLESCNYVLRNVRSGCMVYGMFLCRTKQWGILDSIADQMLVPYERTRYIYPIIRGYIYKAIAAAHLSLSTADKARENLRRALSLAEQDNMRLPFIENGIELLQIMEGMELKGGFIHSLYEDMQHYRRALQQFGKEKNKDILTPREIEVMELVGTGMRNADIGKKMNIALVTVEKNLTSIYRKLEVANRTAAINKWQEIQKNDGQTI